MTPILTNLIAGIGYSALRLAVVRIYPHSYIFAHPTTIMKMHKLTDLKIPPNAAFPLRLCHNFGHMEDLHQIFPYGNVLG